MLEYKAKTFSIPDIKGISAKQIEEHLKLYNGYVKHSNKLASEIGALEKSRGDDAQYVIRELWRRFGFEFNGMRAHEYYFGALEDGTRSFDKTSSIGKKIVEQYKSYERFEELLKKLASTRGSGWASVYWDSVANQLLLGWADEHHIGTLVSLSPILMIDCWEHAYMVDYLPGERGKYVDSYLNALNWETINTWFEKAVND